MTANDLQKPPVNELNRQCYKNGSYIKIGPFISHVLLFNALFSQEEMQASSYVKYLMLTHNTNNNTERKQESQY
jgi:hypothetical protein